MFDLSITRDELRHKLHNILVDLTLEMIEPEVSREKMDRLHQHGVELEGIDHKLTHCKLTLTDEDLWKLNEALDTVFDNLVLEEAVQKIQHSNKRAHEANKVLDAPRPDLRAERLRLFRLYSRCAEQQAGRRGYSPCY